jgi:hypothetical protein
MVPLPGFLMVPIHFIAGFAMQHPHPSLLRQRILLLPSPPAWLLPGAAMALADLLVAALYWSAYGLAPVQILQSIAAWVLGPSAFAGGMASAGMGLLLYLAVICTMVAAYLRASRWLPALLRWPLAFGGAYGAAMYLLLFEVLLPLFSATGSALGPWHWRLVCAGAFVLLIGVPSGYLARVTR